MKNKIIIKGAKEHNLKNIDLELPRNKLIVITGVSGSGKSSLAFDTIYAEGQRRYVESLSAYARQFLEQMEKPEVEFIEGLSPAIAIEQKSVSKNPRSTVATVTEIYDYLRLLFARIGEVHCPKCKKKISQQTSQQIIDNILQFPEGTRLIILAPIIRGRKGEYIKVFEEIRRQGYVRVRVDGIIRDVDEDIKLEKYKKHNIEVVVDRLIIKPDIRRRLADSVETALKLGNGIIYVNIPDDPNKKDLVFSEHFACVECGISFEELTPTMFSFNSPQGACPTCHGLGTALELDPNLIVPNPNKSIREGAIAPWSHIAAFYASGGTGIASYYYRSLERVAVKYGIDLDAPFKTLSEKQKKIIFYGENYDKHSRFSSISSYFYDNSDDDFFEGVIPHLERRFETTESEYVRNEIFKYMSERPCPACGGGRLRPESLAVTVDNKSIKEVTALSVKEAMQFFTELENKLTDREKKIVYRVLKEIKNRLQFLINVGLDYLTLDRPAATLSGGEGQRIRLATQIGSQLVGVLYILDEPSIGLHQRDNRRLLDTLCSLRDLGNTVIVVEHDEETIRTADYVVDLGPGAGKHGGYVVASGPPESIIKCEASLTGKYLSGELRIPVPKKRRPLTRKFLELFGVKHNNLKNIDVKIPLGLFVVVSGVSGSGKSSLINDVLYKALAQHFYNSKEKPGKFDKIKGIEHIDKVINVDQSPIGRTPRSNPATYTGVFTPIRQLFSQVPEARLRGYKPGRFSFNVKGGRCEHCQGDGTIKIEMHFLPDVYVKCDVCKGKRFNAETLEIKYKGKNISEVLEMTVEEALDFFYNIPHIKRYLQTLYDVGLGYIELGQSATTLSGGEAQRVKLAAELSKKSTGRTLYILDEPTTGLHFADVQKLLDVLNRLVDAGNTVVVIEHNLDVIKSADYIIDLGPESGDAGGYIVGCGTPEELAKNQNSYTGLFLRKVLPAW